MRTSATNRKLRVLLTGITNRTLIPRPEFQRRLVWSNKDKIAFIQTVLDGYPFPEIYIAAGDVNAETGEGTEMLVDGQQRITTLHQYFKASPDLILPKDVPSYSTLRNEDKIAFLEYEVVIRDLGKMDLGEIKQVFQRINSTNYALNAMEIHNARYEGAFKQFGEELAANRFFETNKIFSSTDVRRMQDVRFCLTLAITHISSYFNRDEQLETYLEKYNDEFDFAEDLKKQFENAFHFIDSANFSNNSRAWKRADLFTLIVEYMRAAFKRKLKFDSEVVTRLKKFYDDVDLKAAEQDVSSSLFKYYKAALQATNDRGNRVLRGEVLQAVFDPTYQLDLPLEAKADQR